VWGSITETGESSFPEFYYPFFFTESDVGRCLTPYRTKPIQSIALLLAKARRDERPDSRLKLLVVCCRLLGYERRRLLVS
jgi:hypothetical protein